MPQSGFSWLAEEQWARIEWVAQRGDQYTGYFVECDSDYPGTLHESHNDYPLAPESVAVTTVAAGIMCTIRTRRGSLSQFKFQLHPYAQVTMSSTNEGERCVAEWKFIRPLAIISSRIFVNDAGSIGRKRYNSDTCRLTSRPIAVRYFIIRYR